LFANSPLRNGKKTGDLSFRQRVWREVDPARCGLRPEYFASGFGYRAYAEWALDVPMIFVRRNGEYLDPGNLTFRAFMANGLTGANPTQATLSDWEDHLTTLFPEIRLKRVIEVRGADVGDARMCLALPALWKGVLYADDALDAAAKLVPLPFPELARLSEDAARLGFTARVGKLTVLELCRELVEIAAVGLRAQESCGPDEGRFLDVLREELQRGRTPAEEALALLDGPLHGDATKLIDHWRVA
jgi:glutamate--cysteine ligase